MSVSGMSTQAFCRAVLPGHRESATAPQTLPGLHTGEIIRLAMFPSRLEAYMSSPSRCERVLISGHFSEGTCQKIEDAGDGHSTDRGRIRLPGILDGGQNVAHLDSATCGEKQIWAHKGGR